VSRFRGKTGRRPSRHRGSVRGKFGRSGGRCDHRRRCMLHRCSSRSLFFVRSRAARIPRAADTRQRTGAIDDNRGDEMPCTRARGWRINSGVANRANTIPSNWPGLPFLRPKRLADCVAGFRSSPVGKTQLLRHLDSVQHSARPALDKLPPDYPLINTQSSQIAPS
jgi:hypothetical protein